MSLELTDEERALVRADSLDYREEVLRLVILKLQAEKMKAEFWQNKWNAVIEDRHTWTDEQWLEAAKAELRREQ